jgi:hypothetical protein
MIGTIEITDANQSVTIEDELDELKSVMQEVRTHIETARTLIWSAKQETRGTYATSVHEALNLADAHLGFALSAWEPDPH